MGMVDAKNKVPQMQRYYQQAYRNHIRLWEIHPRSQFMLIPYKILLWGSASAALYMAGRKVAGHNTWFGKD